MNKCRDSFIQTSDASGEARGEGREQRQVSRLPEGEEREGGIKIRERERKV